MAVLCGMPTIQYSARSAWLSVPLYEWACPKITVVKVIWHKAHRCRIWMVQCYSIGDGNVSSHEGILAPPGEYDWTCASFGPLESTTKMPNRSVQQCLHRWLRSVLILYNGLPVSHSKLPLPMLACRRHVIRGSLGPPESWAQIATWSLQPFFQDSLVWQTDRATDRQTYQATGVIMRNSVGYGKATQIISPLFSRYLYV